MLHLELLSTCVFSEVSCMCNIICTQECRAADIRISWCARSDYDNDDDDNNDDDSDTDNNNYHVILGMDGI